MESLDEHTCRNTLSSTATLRWSSPGPSPGLLAWRLRQPILLGYVLAGLILSPLTPGIRVHDVHTFEIMAEIGVILLMFSVGIHFSIPELLKVKWVALLGAPVGIFLSVGLGTGV